MSSSSRLSSPTLGTLAVVGTPIGNLSDISPRAIQTLNEVDLILAEDTRTFRTLADRLGICTPVSSYHEHNEVTASVTFVEKLISGSNLALVSDSGMPGISDPGYRLIRACRLQGIPVTTIPGPSAPLAALSISGLATDRFTFEGFLPHKTGKRETILRNSIATETTTIFFESPYRIIKTLALLEEIAPQRELFVARELTKKFEETFFGTASTIRKELEKKGAVKGEFVLIVGSKDG